jgi:hypothetical protein
MTASLPLPCAESPPASHRPRPPFFRGIIEANNDPRLKHTDKVVLRALEIVGRFSLPHVRAPQREVAAHSGVSLRGVRNSYKRLEDCGYITRQTGYRPTHTCAEITLNYDFPARGEKITPIPTIWQPPPQPSPEPSPQPSPEPSPPPMRQTTPADDPPMRQNASTYAAKPGPPMRQNSPPKMHIPTLYKDLESLNTERGRRESPHPSNCSTFPNGSKKAPWIVASEYLEGRYADHHARVEAALIPDPLDHDCKQEEPYQWNP